MSGTQFTIETSGPGLYEFTREVARWVTGEGLLTLFVRHTSCSLLIQENADPEVQTDLQNFFHRLVPPSSDPSMSYLTHTYEGPDDMPAHIKAAMLPVSVSIPVVGGAMVLGTWQGIYLFEHRQPPASADSCGAYNARFAIRAAWCFGFARPPRGLML